MIARMRAATASFDPAIEASTSPVGVMTSTSLSSALMACGPLETIRSQNFFSSLASAGRVALSAAWDGGGGASGPLSAGSDFATPEKKQEVFRVLRPTWSKPEDRERLRQAVRDRISKSTQEAVNKP